MASQRYIPVEWVYEQIRTHTGTYPSAWRLLLDLWEEHLLSEQPVPNATKKDEYIRMHQDMTAAQKFWRNE